MGHWSSGGLLAGKTTSPAPHSLPAEFVELGEKLRAYAEAKPAESARAKESLLMQAVRLRRRLERLLNASR